MIGALNHINAVLGSSLDSIDFNTGRFERFSTSNKASDDAGWYQGFSLRKRDGTDYYIVIFGDWRLGESGKWCSLDENELDDFDRTALNLIQNDAKKKLQLEQAAATDRVKEFVSFIKPANNGHDYLVRKGVKAHGIFEFKGDLVIPIYKGLDNPEVISCQTIKPDGEKRFFSGAPVKEGYYIVGTDPGKGIILLAEGFATGASLHEATLLPVAVAFSGGNMAAIALMLRYRDAVICADNDSSGVGLNYAKKAAQTAKGIVIPDEIGDWNDIGIKHGLSFIRDKIMDAVRGINDANAETREIIQKTNSRSNVAILNNKKDLILEELPVPELELLAKWIDAHGNTSDMTTARGAALAFASTVGSGTYRFDGSKEPAALSVAFLKPSIDNALYALDCITKAGKNCGFENQFITNRYGTGHLLEDELLAYRPQTWVTTDLISTILSAEKQPHSYAATLSTIITRAMCSNNMMLRFLGDKKSNAPAENRLLNPVFNIATILPVDSMSELLRKKILGNGLMQSFFFVPNRSSTQRKNPANLPIPEIIIQRVSEIRSFLPKENESEFNKENDKEEIFVKYLEDPAIYYDQIAPHDGAARVFRRLCLTMAIWDRSGLITGNIVRYAVKAMQVSEATFREIKSTHQVDDRKLSIYDTILDKLLKAGKEGLKEYHLIQKIRGYKALKTEERAELINRMILDESIKLLTTENGSAKILVHCSFVL